MKCVVFVPGILGSELEDSAHHRVWPPKVSEIVFGYDRIDELMADGLTAVRVIPKIGIWPVYSSILNDIQRCGYSEEGEDRRFLPFPYDWRRSNALSAQMLATKLDSIEGIFELILIGHSMGGLVLRYLIESGEFNDRSWFSAISTLITLGTPHFGAPEALAELRGTTSKLGVSGPDLVKLASDCRYPSLYQLVSAPGTALTLGTTSRGKVPRPVDAFSPGIAQQLDLKDGNIRAARDFWSKLGIDRRPHGSDDDGQEAPLIDYFFFGGAAHKTTVRNEWDQATGQLKPIERRQSGDGTVPVACSVVPELPHGFSEKVHKHVFGDRDLRYALYQFLDAPVDIKPQAADETVEVGALDSFGISIDRETYEVGQPIEIVASYNTKVSDPTEAFQILPLDPDSGEIDQELKPISFKVDFQGVDLSSFSFTISPDLQSGLYELRPFRQVDDSERTFFVVAEVPDGH
jgi:pimeloyl-ACP methyl ester carboxylesterase